MKRSPCGKHTTLSDNPGAKVSRCPCGTLHVHLKHAGLTAQLSEEHFQQLGLAVMGAVSALGTPAVSQGQPPAPPDRTIN